MLTTLRDFAGAGLVATLVAALPVQTQPGERQSFSPPPLVVGTFADDYGSTHVIDAKEWRHGRAATYRVVRWDTEHQFLIAQNGDRNPSDPNLWTRIDWMPLENMAPYSWAFCMSTYNAKSFDEALKANIARRDTPKTGCNGFPFTRMKKQ